MNYLFSYGNLTPTAYTQPMFGLNNNNSNTAKPSDNVLNGKERDNTWLQLPVCPNLIKNPEEHHECEPDAKCRANYGTILCILCLGVSLIKRNFRKIDMIDPLSLVYKTIPGYGLTIHQR